MYLKLSHTGGYLNFQCLYIAKSSHFSKISIAICRFVNSKVSNRYTNAPFQLKFVGSSPSLAVDTCLLLSQLETSAILSSLLICVLCLFICLCGFFLQPLLTNKLVHFHLFIESTRVFKFLTFT